MSTYRHLGGKKSIHQSYWRFEERFLFSHDYDVITVKINENERYLSFQNSHRAVRKKIHDISTGLLIFTIMIKARDR